MKFYITILLLFSAFVLNAQNAIKLEKQPTKFYYGQLNLHGGFLGDINGQRWDFASRSPKNQAVFQVFSKNQKNMQRGYTRLINVASWKLRLGLEYDTEVSDFGQKSGKVNFKLLDTFVKFKTKWDRTSITVGNKSIPYGHNPKIDPVVSFMVNPIKLDLGFAQDIGVFFKTPIGPEADFEISFTSGGMLNKPVLVCNDLILQNESSVDFNPDFELAHFDYEDTWLITSRVGSPSYMRNELGFSGVVGRIRNTAILNDISLISRIGGEWVYKYSERFKVVNQVFVGTSKAMTGGEFYSVNMMNNMDYYSGKNWMVSVSHSINSLKSLYNDGDLYNQSVHGSVSYVFSPHTRLRVNSFYTHVRDANEKQYGVLLQFVTGLGKRP